MMNTPSGGRTKLSLSTQNHLSRSTERKPRLIHSSSSKHSSVLHRHQMNWSRGSSINYAATHQLCSIRLSCSEKHTSQPLLMPSGYFLDLIFKPISQIKTVDVLDGGGGGTHSTNPTVSRIYIQMHRQPVHSVCNAQVQRCHVVFDSYGSTNTKDMTLQRRSKGNAGTTVTLTGDTKVTLTKDQFLAKRQNKELRDTPCFGKC